MTLNTADGKISVMKDMVTVIGLIIGIGGILLGNIIEGGHVSSLVQFAAAVIVISGTLGAVLVSSKKSDLNRSIEFARRVFFSEGQKDLSKTRDQIIELSRFSKKESVLALESKIEGIRNPFLKDMIRAVVDGVNGDVLREVFEQEITHEEKQLNAAAKVWTDAGGFAPTIGIIGAVLGLIHVMGNLTDTSKLGSGIAVAFVATIYGVALANLVLIPIGNKLKRNVSTELMEKEMILEGGLCILQGLPPSLTEIKLKPFLQD